MQKVLKSILFSLLVYSPTALPLIIETFGDSLTHGIMAKTSIEHGNPTLVSAMMSDASKFKLTGEVEYIEKYGARNDAWPNYLKDVIQAETSSPVQVMNMAILAQKSGDLEKQVSNIQFSSGSDLKAFFFMGHNDLCHSIDSSLESLVSNFRDNYRRALLLWDTLHHGGTAYMIPVGHVDEVFMLLNQYVWFKEANGQQYRCNDNWGLYFPYCRKFGVLTKQGKIREVLNPRIQAINQVLLELVDEMNRVSTKNHYRFMKDMGDIAMSIKYFALDCFHLSSEGQRGFAKEVHNRLVH